MRAMQLNPGKPQTTPELAASYADRELMWRNIALIGLCNVGWGVVSKTRVSVHFMSGPVQNRTETEQNRTETEQKWNSVLL
jgi:hypothetical protein